MIKFPYGISDFQDIIKNKYYYVDRTNRIPQIEETGRQLLFLRPRRFGKSLLLSMIESYYDVAHADKFEEIFCNLEIGKNPTKFHNKYFVLKWDFSVVNPQGSAQEIKQAIHRYINSRIENFAVMHKKLLPNEITIHSFDCVISFQSLLTVIQQTSYRLYLLIDEYDNFANELMMGSGKTDLERYKTLLYGEGALKSLFKTIKSAAAGQGLERVFITGVSPVVMSDITSGYNVAEDIYLKPKFHDLCGFRDSEIEAALKQIARECNFPMEEVDSALTMMRTFYNGYRFTYEEKPLVYNPTLALYFMKEFQDNCKYPRNMLDSNLAMDRGKLRYIARIPEGDTFIVKALGEESPIIIYNLADRFGVEDMLTVTKDYDFFASLLYYFGILTMGGEAYLDKSVLTIPNLVIRKLYVEQIQDMLLPGYKNDAVKAAETFYLTGSLQPVCDFIENRYFTIFSNRDYRWTNELTVKSVFLTLLFNDFLYIMDSEASLERSYADLTMIVRPDKRKFNLIDILIEFKYINLTDARLTGKMAKGMLIDELKAIPIVQEKLSEAQEKLKQYSQILREKYDDLLRLHCYGVVSIGFDRVVWEELETEL
jgi:hypothetical protein